MSESMKCRLFNIIIYSLLTFGVAGTVYAGENSMQFALGLIFGA